MTQSHEVWPNTISVGRAYGAFHRRRPWRERIFSRPWRPWVRWEQVTPVGPVTFNPDGTVSVTVERP